MNDLVDVSVEFLEMFFGDDIGDYKLVLTAIGGGDESLLKVTRSACTAGHFNVMRELLTMISDRKITMSDEWRKSFFRQACIGENLQMAQYIYKNLSPDIDYKSLLYAYYCGSNVTIWDWLFDIQAKKFPDRRDEIFTALLYNVSNGDIISRYLAKFPDTVLTDTNALIHRCKYKKSLEFMIWLFGKFPNVAVKFSGKDLFYVYINDRELFLWLIGNVAGVDIRCDGDKFLKKICKYHDNAYRHVMWVLMMSSRYNDIAIIDDIVEWGLINTLCRYRDLYRIAIEKKKRGNL